jgi:hypothetical protein
MPKMRFAVVESCIVSPFKIARIPSECGSPTSAAGTSGPTGQKVSGDFPRVHCPSENCRSRADTSFATRYPATASKAFSFDTLLTVVPMTTPSSAS